MQTPNTSEVTLTPAEVLNFKRLSLLELDDACVAFEAEGHVLDFYLQEVMSEIDESTKASTDFQAEVDQEREINSKIKQQQQQCLGEKPQKVIGQFERRIEENLNTLKKMKETLDELEEEISLAKIMRQQKQDELCFKQSELDSINLGSSRKQQQIYKIKQNILDIESFLSKSTLQQQEMFNLKKRLNNELQEYKGNIRVYCRVRPSHNPQNISPVVITNTDNNVLTLKLTKDHIIEGQEKYEQHFVFQQLFAETDRQERVFQEISQLVQSSIDGKNVCIFAYGQTGSGKTFTLIGPEVEYNQSISSHNQRGLTPRSIELIFEEIALCESFKWKYSVYLSIQQIYLETIIDLIGKWTTTMDKIKEIQVFSPVEVETYLKEAKFNRKTSATNMNERSSRSHLIVSLRLEGLNAVTNESRNGSLVLVDLAGSERIKQSKVQGESLKETQFINKSLSSLGTVIHGIRKKLEHIPFRNSKLTHVLQRYLEGDSKTLMFVNISPDIEDAFQTKISLNFAESVKQCKLIKK